MKDSRVSDDWLRCMLWSNPVREGRATLPPGMATLFEDLMAERPKTLRGADSNQEHGRGNGWQKRRPVMADGAREQRWSYPPDYVSAETLAYRLDCSRSTIDSYVRNGLLPKPETIGNLQRWDFGQVKDFIKAKNAFNHENGMDGPASDEDDAYVKGLRSGSAKKGGR